MGVVFDYNFKEMELAKQHKARQRREILPMKPVSCHILK
jgi:hypothetical protein